MRFDGPQMIRLRDALLEAFSPQQFDEMLLSQLNCRRTDIAGGPDQRTIILQVITDYNYKFSIDSLLRATRLSRPRDPSLQALAQEIGCAIALPQEIKDSHNLERTIRQSNSMLDVVRWRTRLAEIEHQVCKIELDALHGPMLGTGFLIGPSHILTNYHVLEGVVKGQIPPTRVEMRFDFALMSGSMDPHPGTVYQLAEQDWLICSSEYSPCDLGSCLDSELPQPDQLDFVLVRLAKTIGNEPVGGALNKDPNATKRGWIRLPSEPYQFARNSALFIVQHPDGKPLKLALDTDSVIGLNENRTRVRYRTNTEGGSSGSPCFNANWTPVAIHQSGDPYHKGFSQSGYNQGIPLAMIRKYLDQQGALLD